MHSSLPFQAAMCSAQVPPCRRSEAGQDETPCSWLARAADEQCSPVRLRSAAVAAGEYVCVAAQDWPLHRDRCCLQTTPTVRAQQHIVPAAFTLIALQVGGQQHWHAALKMHIPHNQEGFAGHPDGFLRQRPQLPSPSHSSRATALACRSSKCRHTTNNLETVLPHQPALCRISPRLSKTGFPAAVTVCSPAGPLAASPS